MCCPFLPQTAWAVGTGATAGQHALQLGQGALVCDSGKQCVQRGPTPRSTPGLRPPQVPGRLTLQGRGEGLWLGKQLGHSSCLPQFSGGVGWGAGLNLPWPLAEFLEHVSQSAPDLGCPRPRLQLVGSEPVLPALARRGQHCLRMVGQASPLLDLVFCVAPGHGGWVASLARRRHLCQPSHSAATSALFPSFPV